MSPDMILPISKIALDSNPSFVEGIAITNGEPKAIQNNKSIFHHSARTTSFVDGTRCAVIQDIEPLDMHVLKKIHIFGV